MMVPRAFLFSSAPPQKHFQSNGLKPSTPSDSSDLHLPATQTENRGSLHTIPVGIPPKRCSRTISERRTSRSRTPSKTSESSCRSSSSSSNDRPIPTSFISMLDATAIPVPRRNWSTRRPRKLPRGNHAEDFRRMMQEDLKSKEDHFLNETAYSPLDLLLSPPEDNEKVLIGNDSEHESLESVRSTSSDSMPSLDHGLASPSSLSSPPTPPSQRSPLEKRQPRYSNCEECAFDHPLLETELEDCEFIDIKAGNEPVTPDTASSKRSASFGRLGSTFKSNLTASLRAIKSAAQSVSTFATPSVQPEDFLTRSLFTITPEMTDDRRPLPMQETPSPALRRYLNPSPMNPTPISPAEMYVYHDPHDTEQASGACPVSIQMQTYRRTGGRGNRRNQFHIASKDQGQVVFDPEVPPMSRQREIRENSDFLRVIVLEMNMRRSGKLREDIPPRARIWLPARKINYRLSGNYADGDDNNTVPSRWVGVSAQ